MILFIVSALISAVALGVAIYLLVKFVKSVIPTTNFISLLKKLLIVGAVFTVGFTTMMISIYLWGKISPKPYELSAAIIGGLLTGFLGYVSLCSFVLHYYGGGEEKGIPHGIDKWMFKALMAAFPLFIISIMFLTDGFASYVTYPLPNGLNFTKGFVNPLSSDGPNIAFYALCILSGAIYVYFLCDHKMYLQYGKHGLLESTFIVAFPAGILGARIFYVIGNWNVEFAGEQLWKIFAIWEGGLTVIGGAITGIVVGVAWFMWRNKGYNIWVAVDIIVPTILIAQAVGRWGNLFNCEVHGILQPDSNWSWLPKFIVENARFSSTSGIAPEGMIYVPLFFIECLTNLLGYFVIAHVFGVALRKHTQLGDLAFGYVVWYGLTRVLMEPLRDADFNMGKNGYWSWIWSLVFVIGGALAIALNHLIRYLLHKKEVNRNLYLFGSIGVGLVSITLIAIASMMMATSKATATLVLNKFNWGLIVLALGISVFFGLLITLPPLFIKKKEEPQMEVVEEVNNKEQ